MPLKPAVPSKISKLKIPTDQNPETQNPEIQNPDRFKILTDTKS
ncbi:7819_t:CDS:2 [Funneliformis geosporum]|uniref:7819_t:CDS:1 n=1 Tax=Funneliformis geosporum TaxID=1117311 RepID=A0A9W4SHU3_9GLOM|nr:7819_t:CDS:2 [Funneliformis geosporum]